MLMSKHTRGRVVRAKNKRTCHKRRTVHYEDASKRTFSCAKERARFVVIDSAETATLNG